MLIVEGKNVEEMRRKPLQAFCRSLGYEVSAGASKEEMLTILRARAAMDDAKTRYEQTVKESA